MSIKLNHSQNPKCYGPGRIRTHDLRVTVVIKQKLVRISYHIDITFPDTLLIGFASEAVDKERGDFKHDYIIYSTAQNQIVSTAKADLVAYDYKEKKRQPVPDEWVF